MKAKVDILKELGHVRNEKITDKGQFAANIYGYELILSEMFEANILDNLNLEELAVLILSVVYEPRKGQHKPKLGKMTKKIQAETEYIIKRIHRLEKTVGLKEKTKKCYFHLSPIIENWIKGHDFNEILRETNADEGEVVRCFRMTIQVLRQIVEYPVSEVLKLNLLTLIKMINRDVIDSEKQLRS